MAIQPINLSHKSSEARFVSGHGFSRAVTRLPQNRALATEGTHFAAQGLKPVVFISPFRHDSSRALIRPETICEMASTRLRGQGRHRRLRVAFCRSRSLPSTRSRTIKATAMAITVSSCAPEAAEHSPPSRRMKVRQSCRRRLLLNNSGFPARVASISPSISGLVTSRRYPACPLADGIHVGSRPPASSSTE